MRLTDIMRAVRRCLIEIRGNKGILVVYAEGQLQELGANFKSQEPGLPGIHLEAHLAAARHQVDDALVGRAFGFISYRQDRQVPDGTQGLSQPAAGRWR